MSSGLRIDYLGPSMMLAASALAGEHQARRHTVAHRRTLAQVSVTTPPDVVFHRPLDRTAEGLVGTCALARHLPDHVLLAPMFTDFGPSNEMFLVHALRGNCHPKMLIHWLGSAGRTPCQLLDRAEGAVRSTSGVDFTEPFTRPLDVSRPDLGEVMASRQRFGRLLYVAASSREWATWGDLTGLLGVGDGVVRNTNGELGNVLKESGMVPAASRWTAQRFTRFVTEYRSFIVAFGHYHLGYEPPAAQWWCTTPFVEAS